jgi:osmoprotectant transport system substrate-binding protein
VLEDDLDTQPAENLAPVVRNDLLEQVEGGADTLAAILDPISAAITTEVLTELGVRVAVDQESIDDVAADFLASLEE